MTAPDSPAVPVSRGEVLAEARAWLAGERRTVRASQPADPPPGRRVPDALGVRVVAAAGCAIPAAVRTVQRGAVAAARARGAAGPGTTGRSEVLLLIVPGPVPIGVDELELLAHAATPPQAVVFVVAVGRRGPALAASVDRHRAVLTEYAPGYRECTFVGEGASAAQLREAVGRARACAAGIDCAAALAAAAVDEGLARLGRARAAQREDARRKEARLIAHRADLAEQRTRLRAPGGAPARMTALRTDVARTKMEVGHEIGARCRGIGASTRAELDGAGRAQVRAYPQRLRGLLAATGDVLERLLDEKLDGLTGGAPCESPAGAGLSVAGSSVAGPLRPRRRAAEDRVMIVMGASGGLGVARLILASPLAGAGPWSMLAWPAALLLGGVIAWWIVRSRTHMAERARMRQWAGEAVAEFRAAWERHLAQRVLDAEASGVGRAGAETAAEAAALDRRIAETERDLAVLRKRTAQSEARAELRRDRGRAVRRRLAELHGAAAPPSGTGGSTAVK